LILIIVCTLSGCTTNHSKVDRKTRIKMQQYTIAGKKLYNLYCSNCHGEKGGGLAKLIPPLKDSDYLYQNLGSIFCSIKYGLQGPAEINGIVYNQPMPANEQLTPLEIAEILTYIFNELNNDQRLVSVNKVAKALNDCTETL